MDTKNILYFLYKGDKRVGVIHRNGAYFLLAKDIFVNEEEIEPIYNFFETLKGNIRMGFVDLKGFRSGLPPSYRLIVPYREGE